MMAETVVEPRTFDDLRSYFERNSSLETTLDLSSLEHEDIIGSDLRSYTQTLVHGHRGMKHVIIDMLRCPVFFPQAYSNILMYATSLESLTLDVSADVRDEGELNLQREKAATIIGGLATNSSCRLKTFKTWTCANSHALRDFFSSAACSELENFAFSSITPMNGDSKRGFISGLASLTKLTCVSLECFKVDDVLALSVVLLNLKELNLFVRPEWGKWLETILAQLLSISRLETLRLNTIDPTENILSHLSGVEVTPSLKVLELDGFQVFSEPDIQLPRRNASLQTLRFRECAFGPQSLAFLMSFEGISSLEFDQCHTQHAKCISFASYLKSLARLKSCKIVDFEPSRDVLADIADGLSQCAELESVTFEKLQDTDSFDMLERPALSDLVRSCRGRLDLHFPDDSGNREILRGVLEGLRSIHCSLKHFSLFYRTRSHDMAQGDRLSVVEAACTIQGLESFHLSLDDVHPNDDIPSTDIDEACVRAICRLLESTALSFLSIAQCRMPTACIPILCSGLRSRESPLTLHLESVVFLPGDVAEEFGPQIQHMACLKELKLSTEFWTSDDSEGFLELLPDMKHLNVLGFDPKLCVMQETRDSELLITGATENASLTEFQGLEYGPGLDETKRRLDFMLRRNRYGWRLLTSGRDVPPALWSRVLANIAHGDDSTGFLYMFLREMQELMKPANASVGKPRQGRRARGQTNQSPSKRSKA
jgi:hypothetical protein